MPESTDNTVPESTSRAPGVAGEGVSGNGGGGGGGGGGVDDIHRLSRCGESLYELLELEKTATSQDIKKKYRRLALKYHPDKNPNNPEAEEKFKRINHAHGILTDEKKKEVYDKYGSFGLRIHEQFGDEVIDYIMMFSSKWFQCLFWSCGILTGCFFGCCCCCCCCCFCCGFCKPPSADDEETFPDLADFEEAGDQDEDKATSSNVVADQPKASNGTNGATVIAMPPPSSSEEATETTALNSGDKTSYTPKMTTSASPKKILKS